MSGKKVLKFGGSSLSNAENIMQCFRIMKDRSEPGDIIVLSAKGIAPGGQGFKTTDELLALGYMIAVKHLMETGTLKPEDLERMREKESALQTLQRITDAHLGVSSLLAHICDSHRSLARELGLADTILNDEIGSLSEHTSFYQKRPQIFASELNFFNLAIIGRLSDESASYGERKMATIVTALLNSKGIPASLLPFNCIVTDSSFGRAKPLLEPSYARILGETAGVKGHRFIMAGFLGEDQKGNITTLGRSGSDLSGSIGAGALARAPDAKGVGLHIYTDVEGMKFTDPRVVHDPDHIPNMSYEEANELALYGAKLHPDSVKPAMQAGVKIYVRSARNPDGPVTEISKDVNGASSMLTGISRQKVQTIVVSNPAMLGETGAMAAITRIFADAGVSILNSFHTETIFEVTIDARADIDAILPKLKERGDIEVIRNRSKVSMVGRGMKGKKMVLATLAFICGREDIANVNIEDAGQARKEISVTFVVEDEVADRMLNALASIDPDALREFLLTVPLPAHIFKRPISRP